MAGEGTWIDWQYLWDSAKLLKRCRYTLQYTYPYAYYMEVGPRKELFEYQQVSRSSLYFYVSYEKCTCLSLFIIMSIIYFYILGSTRSRNREFVLEGRKG